MGKRADIAVLNAPNHKFLGYHFGVNLVDKVIKNGRLVVDREKQDEPVFINEAECQRLSDILSAQIQLRSALHSVQNTNR